MLKNSSLRTKLYSLLGFSILTLCAVGGGSITYLKNVVATYTHVTDVNMTNLKALNDARSAQRDLVILASNILASSGALEDEEKTLSTFEASSKLFDSAQKTYEEIPALDGEQELRDEVSEAWKVFVNSCDKIIRLSKGGDKIKLLERNKVGAAEFAKGRKMFRDSFNKLTNFHESESKKWGDKAKATAASAKTVLIIVTILGCLSVALVGFFMSEKLSKTLTAISVRISDSSTHTFSASQKISASSDQLSSSTTQQAASLQQTASSMEQMSAMVSKNAENAKKSRGVAASSQEQALEGKKVVLETIRSIEEINDGNGQIRTQIEHSNQQIGEIVKVITEIENKTKVINDIVFQTKLLSFNASVEAARAGEHGKGFAVVAEEVGNLAQMSGDAAKTISSMLEESIQKVQSIIQSSSQQVNALILKNSDKVKSGIEIAKRCGVVLDGTVENVRLMNEMATEIATASEEQSHGVHEINKAMDELDKVTQQNATASQESANASSSLVQQTESLRSVVLDLKAVIEGSKGSGRTASNSSSENSDANERLAS